jgi:F-type H+-transporting ATPase subunit epsilon
MASTIHVDVVSAEESIFSGEAEFVVLPGEAGELGIYPRPSADNESGGAVRIRPAGRRGKPDLRRRRIPVQPALVTVLADTAIRGHDLDEAKALEAKKRAEEALRAQGQQKSQSSKVNSPCSPRNWPRSAGCAGSKPVTAGRPRADTGHCIPLYSYVCEPRS